MEIKPLFEKVIDWTQDDDLIDFVNYWNMLQTKSEGLPVHQREMGKWTDSWSHFMNKILFDGEYGIEEIGLGYIRINDEYWNNLDQNIRNVFLKQGT